MCALYDTVVGPFRPDDNKHQTKVENGVIYYVFHYSKGPGMYYPVCGMMHIKEPLLLIGKSSPCGGSGFPLSLSEWSYTICPTPYNRK